MTMKAMCAAKLDRNDVFTETTVDSTPRNWSEESNVGVVSDKVDRKDLL